FAAICQKWGCYTPPPKRTVDGVEQSYPPTTAEEKLTRKNELKACGTFLMALSNEHQLKFNSYKNAKSQMEAIKKRAPKKNKNREPVRRNMTVETIDANALVAQDGFGQVFDSQVVDNQVSDRYKTCEGYHAVPPPYTRNFMPPKPDLILADMDEPNSIVVNRVRENQVNAVKASACWVWRPTKLNSASITLKKHNYTDARGISKNMTGNISYLFEYEEIDGGYVAFREDPKRDTKCVVLSPDFKLLDESQVLLRVPSKNNMYNVDLQNVAPLEETKEETSGILKALIKGIGNLIDHKGKFDGKDDEGFFVGCSMNSKAFRVFNSRAKIVEETLNITFLENKSNVAGSGPTWLFDIDTLPTSMNYKPIVVGNQSNGSAGKAIVEIVPDKDYILLPLWTQNPLLSSSSKDSPGDGFKPSGEEEKKDAKIPGNEDNEVLSTEEPKVNQEKDANVNNTNNINIVSQTNNVAGIKDNVVDEKIVYRYDDDPNMPNLEEIIYSDDDKDVAAEADMTNLDTNILVSHIVTTRIHKDHPVEQIIGDIHSASQTRRMTKNVTNYGLFSSVQQRINHKSFQNYLFVCFLSQVEPKKVIQALTDPIWIEAMQDELLQFKLQEVWTLVDLPYGKRAIRTKWIYRNKKDERGIMVRNKARELVDIVKSLGGYSRSAVGRRGYSSKNYIRKFLRALHPKWRAKVTGIDESKDLTSLSLDELIENLNVYKMIIKKDSKIVKQKVERKSIALKAKKESSNEECLTFDNEDEEYAMETFQRSRDDKNGKSDRKCFRCGDPNHLIGECPKPSKDKNQRAFFEGSWRDNGEEDDEKVKDETCLIAHASSEICLGFDLEPDEWNKDIGCTKHMMGNQNLFSTYKAYNGGNVFFGSNLRGNIIGK
nr:putative ribonuclease H-like domain-containing protein [Tanacetum cinerariifolium]